MNQNIQAAVRDILSGAPAITAEVSERIYGVPAPQAREFPALLLQRISEVTDLQTDGRQTRIQVDCYAYQHTTADNLADAVESVLAGFRGTVGGCDIQFIKPINTVDFYDPESRIYRTAVDFNVAWRRV